ncbi:helix-turn-helix domain-containing protein [Nocardia brevicatena]|uniref:helix-turn-helix domain-containing protein n=1 Tax=Nocardia brevicatena TaxID=37327 RepID=UPI0003143A8A|nr:helix-turn-helix domain-containing protein [Nocardia brevicatena]
MQRLEGVALTDDDAAELAAALDVLAQLAADRGARLSPRLIRLRDGLRAAHDSAHVHARTGVADIVNALTVDMGTVDTAAATVLGLTPDRVRYLCRSGRLPAIRSQGRWWINAVELEAYAGARRVIDRH